MAMASIYWDMSHYSAVERIFRQSAEFCSEHDVWKLNVAHTYFMQDNHYKEAIQCVSASREEGDCEYVTHLDMYFQPIYLMYE